MAKTWGQQMDRQYKEGKRRQRDRDRRRRQAKAFAVLHPLKATKRRLFW